MNFADDGQHVVAVDGQKGYLLDLAAGTPFAVITDTDWKPATHVGYLNGVMVFNELGTGRFFWSQILDPGNLDALDFASAEARPDPLVGLKVVARRTPALWLQQRGMVGADGEFPLAVSASPWRRARYWLLQRALASACSRTPWAGSPVTRQADLP